MAGQAGIVARLNQGHGLRREPLTREYLEGAGE